MAYGTINADLMTTSDGVSSSGLYGFKNRIINGAMVIDQRNAGASVTITTDGTYCLDRWACSSDASSKYSVQQSTTVPAGYKNSLVVTSLSAYSVPSGQVFGINQYIEGLNVADLGWGAAGASTVTLSFWVRSSLTGTFGGVLRNSAGNRCYPFTYTISAADTWEQKSITVAGDTTGTWLTTNGTGIRIIWGLGVGSTYSGTAGSWSSSNYYGATGATSVVGTSGATFYITGVQLEKGSTATSFDYRPYGTELAMCQRYLPIINGSSANSYVGLGQAAASTSIINYIYKTTPRVPPTGIVVSSPSHFSAYNGVATTGFTAISFGQASLDMCTLSCTNITSLTAGTSAGMYFTSPSAQIQFTGCEL